ncbi:MAG: glycosyltransferase family 2 protein [Lachnospiraceae bacterium]|nr:glycosyltransferase family 2 protein [Lachnospiraceae bacterium]
MSDYIKGMVSIVVPTYFSEAYLEKCLSCIVNQTYPNIEVIVSDGDSTDNTPAIIKKFEKRYDFVRCIHKENEGVSASRNCGMAEARGEYLEFVDSDDFLLPDACETLVRAMEKTGADVVIAGFTALKTGEERRPERAVFEGAGEFVKSFGTYYYYKKNCLNVPWNKLYRRSAVEAAEAKFPRGLSMGEDLLFNLQVFEGAKRICFVPKLVYEYNNLNDQSLAYRYRENGFEIETMLYEKVLAFVTGQGGDCIEVLNANYLFGIKAKITALVHRSGLTGKQCRHRIGQWTKEPALQQMARQPILGSKKDKVLLFMLRHHMKRSLYWYYRMMA